MFIFCSYISSECLVLNYIFNRIFRSFIYADFSFLNVA
jgi:hypothetical protein